MKRAWIAGSILVLLCALSIWSSLCLGRFTENIISSLEQAQSMAVKDNWQEAARVTSNAERRFREKYFYLHVTLRHSDIDAVEATFREVEQLLTYGERLGGVRRRQRGAYLTAGAALGVGTLRPSEYPVNTELPAVRPPGALPVKCSPVPSAPWQRSGTGDCASCPQGPRSPRPPSPPPFLPFHGPASPWRSWRSPASPPRHGR